MSDHAAAIAVLLAERPTCLDCLALKSGLTFAEVDRYLTTIATALDLVRNERGGCQICGNVGPTFSLLRSAH
jgi:hypothetical protein